MRQYDYPETFQSLTEQKKIQDQSVLTKLNENVPGTSTFVENLSNVKKVRPTVEQYPDVSEALGQAIVSVMLGKEQPADALNSAATAADAALAEK